jgi:hypothetical protein
VSGDEENPLMGLQTDDLYEKQDFSLDVSLDLKPENQDAGLQVGDLVDSSDYPDED